MNRVIRNTTCLAILGLAIAAASLPATTAAQQKQKQRLKEKKASEEQFVKNEPTIGDAFPELTVYDPRGNEVSTASLRGHHTVLTFGCLT